MQNQYYTKQILGKLWITVGDIPGATIKPEKGIKKSILQT